METCVRFVIPHWHPCFLTSNEFWEEWHKTEDLKGVEAKIEDNQAYQNTNVRQLQKRRRKNAPAKAWARKHVSCYMPLTRMFSD